jgi:hypothetical protein
MIAIFHNSVADRGLSVSASKVMTCRNRAVLHAVCLWANCTPQRNNQTSQRKFVRRTVGNGQTVGFFAYEDDAGHQATLLRKK